MINFIKKFQNFCFHQALYQKGSKIIVALSGGPDSTALLLILSKLAKKYDLKLLAIHINYHLRGKESDQDESFVKNLTKELGIPLKIYQYTKNKSAGGNLEEKMREFRYTLFERERTKNKYDLIATAHTMDDRVETFFINLLRGAGSEGLASLKVKRNNIIRPLLFAEKKELLDFLKKNHQQYRVDKSNLDTTLRRNKIRRKLIPYLEKNYGPNMKKLIAQTADQFDQQNNLIDKITKHNYQKLKKGCPGCISLKKKSLQTLDEFLLKKIFRQAIVDTKGNLRDISSAHFFEFKKALESEKSKTKRIVFGNVQITIAGEEIIFKK